MKVLSILPVILLSIILQFVCCADNQIDQYFTDLSYDPKANFSTYFQEYTDVFNLSLDELKVTGSWWRYRKDEVETKYQIGALTFYPNHYCEIGFWPGDTNEFRRNCLFLGEWFIKNGFLIVKLYSYKIYFYNNNESNTRYELLKKPIERKLISLNNLLDTGFSIRPFEKLNISQSDVNFKFTTTENSRVRRYRLIYERDVLTDTVANRFLPLLPKLAELKIDGETLAKNIELLKEIEKE